MMIQRTSKHSIIATPAGGERIDAVIRGHTVATDQPERAGGTDAGPTPLELMSASLASCIALYVHRHCEAEHLDAAEIAVEVKPFWRDNPGRIARFDVVLHLPSSIPEAERPAIEAVALKCPVHHTLTHNPEITLQMQEFAPAVASAG
jgi:putative redox protein